MLAPNFNLNDQNGIKHSLDDYRGQWLVLYFYPKDDTPGCTKEACNFRDGRELLTELNQTAVVGISKDSVGSHRRFSKKYQLNFTLLSDPDHRVISSYQSWKPKEIMGKEFIGTERNTFIINPKGEICKKYEGVDPKTHVTEIIKDLKKLQTEKINSSV